MQPKIFKSKDLHNRSQQEQPTSTAPLITHFNLPSQNKKQNHLSLFPVGSEVEVSSDEEGFGDAWFLATVIPPPSSSSSSLSFSSEHQRPKLFVEYKNLLADETGSALLKEFVDVGFVRPKPPVDKEDKALFELNDVVDAFFQDGWWTGVVTEVILKGREYCYKVFFSNPPDELEFRPSDLRIHKNWVDGKWVLPEKERMGEVKISRATAVEVNTDSPDVWYPAKLIKEVDNSFLVEYQSSREAGYQKLVVDSSHIRPSPPPSSKKCFSLLEKVDAFYDFCWLSGVVTKILADGKYIVYFKHTKKEKELSHTDLRLHMEWANAKWVNSSRDTSLTSIPEKKLECAVNGDKGKLYALASADAKEEKNNAVNLKSSQSFLQIHANEKADNGSTMPRNKRTKQRRVGSILLRKRTPDSGKLRLKQTDKFFNETSTVLDSPTLQKSGVKLSEDINQSSTSVENMGNEKISVPRKRGRPPVTPKRGRPPKQRSIELSVLGKTPNGKSLFTPPLPIVIGLTHDGKMTRSLSRISSSRLKRELSKSKKDEEKCNTENDRKNIVTDDSGSKPQKDREVTSLKRKRGRPAKEAGAGAGAGDANPISAAFYQRRLRILSDHPRGLRAVKARTGRQVKRGPESPKEMPTMELSEPVALRRGRRQKSAKQVKLPTEGGGEGNVRILKNGVSEAVETVAGTSINFSDDDRPLSSWFEGAHCPKTDGTVTAGQCAGIGEKHETSNIQHVGKPKDPAQENQGESKSVSQDKEAFERHDHTPTTVSSAIIPVPANDELPFVKNSLIWKMIESMEVLKQIPQKPHFRPLYDHKEECREGLAIGNMVTFTSLVDRISRIQFSDPKIILDGYKDALTDLEDLGFNVSPVRGKLNALISVKDNYAHAQSIATDMETKITEHDHQKSKIDEEIEGLDKKIAELNEKRALAMSKKEAKDAEMRLLQSSEDAVKGSLEKFKKEFEKLIATDY